ncbi:MAG: hypothetical protein ACREPA_09425 [Candidatus Dormibacteraceae bacterium]
MTDPRRAVASLIAERPDWIPVLEAAIAVSDQVEPNGGEFAGAWVIDELARRAGHRTWLPNLRVLVSYGLVEKSGESTRGGRRAYYRMPAKKAVVEALRRLKPSRAPRRPEQPNRFRLIGSGDSGEPGSDWARRSGDLPFEPSPWR